MSGIERFMAGLDELGFEPEQRGSLVVVKLDVAADERPDLSWVGADPPGEFPNVPPHWLHLKKELVLPDGGGRASELGDDWRKWSRQKKPWKGGDNAAREWLAQVRSLLLGASVT